MIRCLSLEECYEVIVYTREMGPTKSHAPPLPHTD